MGGPNAVRSLTGREEGGGGAPLPSSASPCRRQRRLSSLLQHASPHCRVLMQRAILVLSQGGRERSMVMRSQCAGDALDPPLWTIPNKDLSDSLSLSLSLSQLRRCRLVPSDIDGSVLSGNLLLL